MLEHSLMNRILKQDQVKTPFYYYDLNKIQNRFQQFQKALNFRFKINYSMKANPQAQILATMKKLTPHIDVSSQGEIIQSLAAGYEPQNMSFVGPGKTAEEIQFALKNNIGCMIIESFEELEILGQQSEILKVHSRFCLRINPETMMAPNGQVYHNRPSQFGIDQDQILGLKKYLEKYSKIECVGLHFYLQSQYLNPKYIIENFKISLLIFAEIQKNLNIHFKMINFGGGFGIPYFEGQQEIDLQIFEQEVGDFLKAHETLLKNVDCFVESGRYLVGPAGFFVTQVLYKKVSQKKTYLVCDGGFTQHMAATGHGQAIRRNYRIRTFSFNETSETEKVTISGPSCYSIDILAHDIVLPKLSVGDYVIVENSGAYGLTFSPAAFLSRPAAAEVV